MMAKTALSGAHTAGIYADLTLDGPEIGTLVVIVDRAKNLPNRKTMGKQDPYCAARLGKWAKKTETDKRGGQTPRWDQELRFTVHDTPDYSQLKVSIFNDDRKTELIGETWISLDQIVVPGGGTSDFWHSLNCKGRYAGDIRIELTYYDTRPKLDNGEDRRQSAPVTGSTDKESRGLSGPRQPRSGLKTPIQQRPLPVDPRESARAMPLAQIPPDIALDPVGQSPTDIGMQMARGSPPIDSEKSRRLYNSGTAKTASSKQPQPYMYDPTAQIYNRQYSAPALSQNLQDGQLYDEVNEFDTEYVDDWQPRPSVQPLQNDMVHSNSSPAMIDPRLRHGMMQHAWTDAEASMDEEEVPPPPPPAHRSLPHITPLNTPTRGSTVGSPLATVQSHSPSQGYPPPTSPSHSQIHLNHGMPPSLVPGYEAKMAGDESKEVRRSARHQSLDQPLSYGTQPYSASGNRYSTPVRKPRGVSPDRPSPVRKSLSSQPAPTERVQQSATPFSPDSFDAYNPSISAANSVNDLGARYSTPEQAREASQEHERQEKLGDGPIVGNDGRIIDPSDHLPADTWAPEPEQKTPSRRTPEVTVRFRNSPQGAQPMPLGRRPLNEARTQSASSPLYARSAGNSPSFAPNRNRLNRYPRVSPGNIPPPVPGKVPIGGGGKEDWGDALSEEMRRIDIGSGRRRA